jgi:hypothetical protein
MRALIYSRMKNKSFPSYNGQIFWRQCIPHRNLGFNWSTEPQNLLKFFRAYWHDLLWIRFSHILIEGADVILFSAFVPNTEYINSFLWLRTGDISAQKLGCTALNGKDNASGLAGMYVIVLWKFLRFLLRRIIRKERKTLLRIASMQ